MAGCETPTISAGHAPGGAQADHELTFNPDHPMGADQVPVTLYQAYGGTGRTDKLQSAHAGTPLRIDASLQVSTYSVGVL